MATMKPREDEVLRQANQDSHPLAAEAAGCPQPAGTAGGLPSDRAGGPAAAELDAVAAVVAKQSKAVHGMLAELQAEVATLRGAAAAVDAKQREAHDAMRTEYDARHAKLQAVVDDLRGAMAAAAGRAAEGAAAVSTETKAIVGPQIAPCGDCARMAAEVAAVVAERRVSERRQGELARREAIAQDALADMERTLAEHKEAAAAALAAEREASEQALAAAAEAAAVTLAAEREASRTALAAAAEAAAAAVAAEREACKVAVDAADAKVALLAKQLADAVAPPPAAAVAVGAAAAAATSAEAAQPRTRAAAAALAGAARGAAVVGATAAAATSAEAAGPRRAAEQRVDAAYGQLLRGDSGTLTDRAKAAAASTLNKAGAKLWDAVCNAACAGAWTTVEALLHVHVTAAAPAAAAAAARAGSAVAPMGTITDPMAVGAMYWAGWLGAPLGVKLWLLAAGVSPTAADSAGCTALHGAAYGGDAQWVTLLLELGADPNAKRAGDGWTPLHFAVASDKVDAMEALVAAGADVTLRSADSHWETPTNMARGNTEFERRMEAAVAAHRAMRAGR